MFILRKKNNRTINIKHKVTISLLFVFVVFLSLSPNSYSNDNDQDREYCRILFPNADIISEKFDSPPHYKIFSLDNGSKEKALTGIAFLTTDLAPKVSGYGGKIKILVGLDTSNNIVATHLISHSETPAFTSHFSEFLGQFSGKNIFDNFILEEDVDGMTGATISSTAVNKAISESLIPIKELLLDIKAKSNKKKLHKKPFRKIIIPIFIVALGAASVILRKTYLSETTKILSLIYFGILTNSMLSASHFSDLLLLKLPSLESNAIMFILIFSSILCCIFLGRVYCCNICPFATVQEIVFNISKRLGIKTQNIKKELDSKLQHTKYIILFLLLSLSLFSNKSHIGSIEPYITLFSFMGSKLAWILLAFVLFSSIFYFRFWCRFFCPTGAFLGLLSKFNLFGFKLSKNPKDCGNICPVRAIKCTDQTISKMKPSKLPESIQVGLPACRQARHSGDIHPLVSSEINKSECILCQKCLPLCR